jgi:hypothetical protein
LARFIAYIALKASRRQPTSFPAYKPNLSQSKHIVEIRHIDIEKATGKKSPQRPLTAAFPSEVRRYLGLYT